METTCIVHPQIIDVTRPMSNTTRAQEMRYCEYSFAVGILRFDLSIPSIHSTQWPDPSTHRFAFLGLDTIFLMLLISFKVLIAIHMVLSSCWRCNWLIDKLLTHICCDPFWSDDWIHLQAHRCQDVRLQWCKCISIVKILYCTLHQTERVYVCLCPIFGIVCDNNESVGSTSINNWCMHHPTSLSTLVIDIWVKVSLCLL